MAKYRFSVYINGAGSDLGSAWDDAVLSFGKEPGTCPTYGEYIYELEQGDENDSVFVDGPCPATAEDHAWMELTDPRSVMCKTCGVACSRYENPEDVDNTAWPVALTSILQNEAVK